jgi:hypothetical protein
MIARCMLALLVTVAQSVLSGSTPPASAQTPALNGPYLGQDPPGLVPSVFAPDFVSTDAHEFSCAFSPDAKEFYFARGTGPNNIKEIMVTRLSKNGWTVPEPALPMFNGESFEPRVTPDGKQLFFMGFEPLPGGGRPPINMYCAERVADRLENVRALGEPFNPMKSMFVSFAANGTIYTTDPETKGCDIARSRLVDGVYQKYENLGVPINTDKPEVYPFVAPDESYVLYCQMAGQGPDSAKLMASFRQKDGSWGVPAAVELGMKAGAPTVSPDGKYLFFVSGKPGQGDIYWVDFEVVRKAADSGQK